MNGIFNFVRFVTYTVTAMTVRKAGIGSPQMSIQFLGLKNSTRNGWM